MPNRDQDPFVALSAMAEHPHSRERVERLLETAEGLRSTIPEYVGMTAFGSVVRGEAGEESDVDIYVFFDPTQPANIMGSPRGELPVIAKQDEDDDFPGTYLYGGEPNWGYKYAVGLELSKCRIPDADILVMPISKDIVTEQIAIALAGAELWDMSQEGGPVAPRNIRGLFHAPIDSAGLDEYRRQVIEGYQSSPHGETAWRMLRHMVATFEVGRGGNHKNPTHRNIPETLAEAREYYLS